MSITVVNKKIRVEIIHKVGVNKEKRIFGLGKREEKTWGIMVTRGKLDKVSSAIYNT